MTKIEADWKVISIAEKSGGKYLMLESTEVDTVIIIGVSKGTVTGNQFLKKVSIGTRMRGTFEVLS